MRAAIPCRSTQQRGGPMSEFGIHNPACPIGASGFSTTGTVRYNFGAAALYEEALGRGEARLSAHGALVAATGQHTGRSAKGNFIVRGADTEPHGWWEGKQPLTPAPFALLRGELVAPAPDKLLFVQYLMAGADPVHALPGRVITDLAWHSLFTRNLLIGPDRAALSQFAPNLTTIDLPSFRADPARHGTRSET